MVLWNEGYNGPQCSAVVDMYVGGWTACEKLIGGLSRGILAIVVGRVVGTKFNAFSIQKAFGIVLDEFRCVMMDHGSAGEVETKHSPGSDALDSVETYACTSGCHPPSV